MCITDRRLERRLRHVRRILQQAAYRGAPLPIPVADQDTAVGQRSVVERRHRAGGLEHERVVRVRRTTDDPAACGTCRIHRRGCMITDSRLPEPRGRASGSGRPGQAERTVARVDGQNHVPRSAPLSVAPWRLNDENPPAKFRMSVEIARLVLGSPARHVSRRHASRPFTELKFSRTP